MNYLSFDIEATGLKENDLIIEFGMVPVSAKEKKIYREYSYHSFIQCPSFDSLKPNLDPWVIENNEVLINKAHNQGMELSEFKKDITNYFNQEEIKRFFKFPNEKITLLGKSLNAIDLPFLNRDLGWEFMRSYFHHQVLDVSSVVLSKIDQGLIPNECKSGSKLAAHLGLGEIDHTALEDAIMTAEIYFKLI